MKKTMTYEEAITRLNEIVKLLDNNDISLEESVKLFEEGTKLSDFCYKKLNSAEQKITELKSAQEQNNE